MNIHKNGFQTNDYFQKKDRSSAALSLNVFVENKSSKVTENDLLNKQIEGVEINESIDLTLSRKERVIIQNCFSKKFCILGGGVTHYTTQCATVWRRFDSVLQ